MIRGNAIGDLVQLSIRRGIYYDEQKYFFKVIFFETSRSLPLFKMELYDFLYNIIPLINMNIKVLRQ